MKTVRHTSAAREKLLHVETDGAIVNVRVGLHDAQGRAVTSVEIIPDDDSRGGDGSGQFWDLSGVRNNRLIRRAEQAEGVPGLDENIISVSAAELDYLARCVDLGRSDDRAAAILSPDERSALLRRLGGRRE